MLKKLSSPSRFRIEVCDKDFVLHRNLLCLISSLYLPSETLRLEIHLAKTRARIARTYSLDISFSFNRASSANFHAMANEKIFLGILNVQGQRPRAFKIPEKNKDFWYKGTSVGQVLLCSFPRRIYPAWNLSLLVMHSVDVDLTRG